jgi:D-alanine-D-alanine ligase
MRIGLSYDLKGEVEAGLNQVEDAQEEYDYPETIELIASALGAGGHSVVKLGGGRAFLNKVLSEKLDFVFNIAEGRGTYRSREAQVPSVLEMLGIPYTGSDPLSLAVCLDKPLTKQLATQNGVLTPAWRIITDRTGLDAVSWDGFTFPAIIKPAFEGSSKGIRNTSLTHSPAQAREVIAELLEQYRQPVMAEEFIVGDEVTVGLTGNGPPRVVGIMRIVPKQPEDYFVYSLEVKRDWKRLVDYECPAQLQSGTMETIARSSLKVFNALGCRDVARVDFRVTPKGEPFFIEINPLPGLGDYSDLVIMALKLGWRYEALIGAILNAARERYARCTG